MSRTRSAFLVSFILAASCAEDASVPWAAATGEFAERGPLYIFGHAGAPFTEAENTIPSFAAAMAQGADSIELDLCVTLDGEVVVWHDRNPNDVTALARATGGQGYTYIPWVPDWGDPYRRPVELLTLDELRTHYGYQPNLSIVTNTFESGLRDPRYVIPTLREFIAWAQTQPALRAIYLDTKLASVHTDLAMVLAQQVAELTEGAPFEVFLSSPHEPIVLTYRDWFRAHRPEHPVRFIFEQEMAGVLEQTRRLGFDVMSTGFTPLRTWSGYLAEITEVMSQEPKEPLFVWTINERTYLQAMLDAGVGGIITDRVSTVLELRPPL